MRPPAPAFKLTLNAHSPYVHRCLYIGSCMHCGATGHCADQAGENQNFPGGGRQGRVLLPALDHHRATRILQGRRARCRNFRLCRWSARAAGGGRRFGRCLRGCLRTHHQPAIQEPVFPGFRPAGTRPSNCRWRVHEKHVGLPDRWRPEREKNRCLGTGVVHQHGGQSGVVARRAQGERRELYRRWRGGWRIDGHALRPDRCHQQYRSGDDDARAERRRHHRQRHAHAQRHGGCIWRTHAGGLPLCANGVHPEIPEHHPGAGQCHRARPQVAADGRSGRHHQDGA